MTSIMCNCRLDYIAGTNFHLILEKISRERMIRELEIMNMGILKICLTSDVFCDSFNILSARLKFGSRLINISYFLG